jgi:hypothetical protein
MRFLSIVVSLASWLGASGLSTGCSSNFNSEERAATPEAMAAAAANAGGATACVGACFPDPGSREVDMQQSEQGYVFDWKWNLAATGKASFTYRYDDGTLDEPVSALDVWEPTAVPGLVPPAVNLRGGPYTSFGAGFGISFCTIGIGNECTATVAPDANRVPVSGGEFANAALDASGWEGVAIWARRGPNGQSTLRVGVTEKHSSEDLNTPGLVPDLQVQESKYCRRVRSCGCAVGTPCSPASDGNHYCFMPGRDPEPNTAENVTIVQCGEDRCNQVNVSAGVTMSLAPGFSGAQDPLFYGRACTATVTSDGLSGSFCFDPGQDPDPPAKREKCGNPFSRPINVGLDWQLFKVPFSELRQAEEAHVAADFDVSTIKQLVFTHPGGFTDFYVHDVGFYRKAD